MTDPYYTDDNVTLYHGDCLDMLAELPDASVDSVVTDPPYGLEFMGKEWDRFGVDRRQPGDDNYVNSENPFGRSKVRYGTASSYSGDTVGAMQHFQQWCQEWATELLRVLKPGGHLLAFGGTRTWHRLACAVEDAGFEIRDNIAWIYGSGFPKSLDVSKAIDKAAGAEREVVSTIPDRWAGKGNVLQRSQQAEQESVNITAPATPEAKRWQGFGTALKPAFEPVVVARKPLSGTVAANVLAHGTGALNIDATRVPTTDKLGGGHSSGGQQMKDGWHRPWMDDPEAVAANAERSRASVAKSEELGRWPANVLLDPDTAAEVDKQSGNIKTGQRLPHHRDSAKTGFGGGWSETSGRMTAGGDEGGASRFFPVFRYNPKAPTEERPTANGVAHPTVKPLELMRWLVRLVTPPGGTVLEPFAGSGTTAEACIHEHMRCIAIERETDYLPLIVNRLTKPIEIGFDFNT